MPRITAGELKGRNLRYPEGERFRPTMDKVKEALFSIVAEEIIDARVLDLYAAAGALGLEALSRGARQAVFVEQNPQAYRHLEANIRALKVSDRTIVVRQDVRVYLKQSKFFATHIFCDPPYYYSLAKETLDLLAKNPGVTTETLIVLEHASNEEIVLPRSLKIRDSREYGDTRLSFIGKKGV
ncbi:MAG: 16S rRNA (guanine(966)-N(2))-methyltransferase RsmD [Candidatus Stahlbacteria bacterium]|nr:MAG: 16S rRNA (guanine(966)-N(2))-methyltransferase RsmD [Candidatus Stahlbacteria bacterium]